MGTVIVSGSFDNLRSPHIRFLAEASRLGAVHLLLWSDDLVRQIEKHEPKFPQAERQYFLESVRYVDKVSLLEDLPDPDELPLQFIGKGSATWLVEPGNDRPGRKVFCDRNALKYQVLPEARLQGFPAGEPVSADSSATGRKKVLVTGCYDWLHSGHVRFFEEASQYGDLYVGVGQDANLRFLKGEGHPLFSQDERRFMVQSIRFVKQAFISSGMGWMDSEPEVQLLKPDIYLVNDDGDKPEKRAFCGEHGLEYVVLKRLPKEGLPRRESTKLRGF